MNRRKSLLGAVFNSILLQCTQKTKLILKNLTKKNLSIEPIKTILSGTGMYLQSIESPKKDYYIYQADHQDSFLKSNNQVIHLKAKSNLDNERYFESIFFKIPIEWESIENRGYYSNVKGTLILINKPEKTYDKIKFSGIFGS